MLFLKRLVKLIFSLFIIVVLIFGALDVYFSHINHIASTVQAGGARLMAQEHVHALTYDQIPEIYREAVISTEDRRFANDPGIDPIGIVRSLIVDVQHDGYVEGGSTITQQVVDNTLLGQQKTIGRKLLQTLYAVGVYDTMTKADTFTLYANVIYFGQGAYGLYNAAETYFHRTPSQLNAGELTLLAGLPNSPSNFDPFDSMTLAVARQKIVLENMVDAGVLTGQQAQQIRNEPIRLVSN